MFKHLKIFYGKNFRYSLSLNFNYSKFCPFFVLLLLHQLAKYIICFEKERSGVEDFLAVINLSDVQLIEMYFCCFQKSKLSLKQTRRAG